MAVSFGEAPPFLVGLYLCSALYYEEVLILAERENMLAKKCNFKRAGNLKQTSQFHSTALSTAHNITLSISSPVTPYQY